MYLYDVYKVILVIKNKIAALYASKVLLMLKMNCNIPIELYNSTSDLLVAALQIIWMNYQEKSSLIIFYILRFFSCMIY